MSAKGGKCNILTFGRRGDLVSCRLWVIGPICRGLCWSSVLFNSGRNEERKSHCESLWEHLQGAANHRHHHGTHLPLWLVWSNQITQTHTHFIIEGFQVTFSSCNTLFPFSYFHLLLLCISMFSAFLELFWKVMWFMFTLFLNMSGPCLPAYLLLKFVIFHNFFANWLWKTFKKTGMSFLHSAAGEKCRWKE